MQYIFQKVYEHPVLLPLSGKDFFSEAKQDLHGNLYQVLVEPEVPNVESVEGPEAAELSFNSGKYKYKIKITFNDRSVPDLEDKFNAVVFEEDIARKDALKAYWWPEGQRHSGTMVRGETSRETGEMPEEEASMKYDYEILHNSYFVFKSGVDIFYYSLLCYDSQKSKVKRVNL